MDSARRERAHRTSSFLGISLAGMGTDSTSGTRIWRKSQSQSSTRLWVYPLPLTAHALEAFALSLNLFH